MGLCMRVRMAAIMGCNFAVLLSAISVSFVDICCLTACRYIMKARKVRDLHLNISGQHSLQKATFDIFRETF